MLHRIFVVLCLFFGACYADFPRQNEAEDIVWSTYSETEGRPNVGWMLQFQLNCYNDEGWKHIDGTCVGGLHYDSFNSILLALPDKYIRPSGIPEYSKIALAHEFLHAHLKRKYGDSDGSHRAEEWMTLVPLANRNLEAAGL